MARAFTIGVRGALLSAALLGTIVTGAFAQQFPDVQQTLRVSKEISEALLQGDLERAASSASSIAAAPPEAFKTTFSGAANLGKGQYLDLVYARTYGRTEQDVIYKLRFDKAVLFVRCLFHVDQGKWKLFDLKIKSETGAPFPREWLHIYPLAGQQS